MAKRILVLSASVGAGHLRAAQAVELALRELAPAAEIRNVDVLTLTNAPFRKLYGEAYLDLVNKAPHVLGYFYDMMDRPRRKGSTRDRLRLAVERVNLRRLCEQLECGDWDVIVSTHFLPAELIAAMRRKGTIDTPHVTVTTDFETHRLWVNEPCDLYTTATEEGALYLAHWGADPGRVRVTGIPIHPAFATAKSSPACMKRHGLGRAGERPIVLQLSGGFGVGPVEQIFNALLAINLPIEQVIVCGRNANLQRKLSAALPVPGGHPVSVLGFTDQMDELMACADLVVSKPGGLTTSEALARGCAMAIVNPIPGQESRNSDFLLENGAAVKINNVATMAHKLTRLLGDGSALARLKANAKRLGKPRAAYDVARLALALTR